jgi:phosphohistidine phosphatase
MKTLLLIRHAKSSWGSKASTDFDRPLNDRGKADCPVMAARLIKQGYRPDLFVSSPARRARRTAELFIREFGKSKDEILLMPELYHADNSIFQNLISRFDDYYHMAAVFGHNPAISEFVNTLTETRIDDMPTCSIFGIRIETDSWADFEQSEKKFLFFDSPKAGHDG